MCYLTEILDSAQEGFPFLWVNGEKYVFSQEVINYGKEFFEHFLIVKDLIISLVKETQNEEIQEFKVLQEKKTHLEEQLKELDIKWVGYE